MIFGPNDPEDKFGTIERIKDGNLTAVVSELSMAMLAEIAADRTPVGQPSKFWITEACSSIGVRKLTFEDHKDALSKMRSKLGAARVNWNPDSG